MGKITIQLPAKIPSGGIISITITQERCGLGCAHFLGQTRSPLGSLDAMAKVPRIEGV